VATLPVQEHYELGITALGLSNWKEASKQFRIVTGNFPKSTYAQDAFFYLGVAEYHLEEYDFANEAFSNYINTGNNPKHFQEAIEYKFQIAQNLASGSKRRLLGTRRLPKWATGRTLAIKIFDEVIASLSSHELAAQALFAKGNLHRELQYYRPAIEDFQLLIKRFPKNELVPDAYVNISHIYLEMSSHELQNPDILNFAEMNLKKFRTAFPREERLADVEQDLEDIKETYAQGLYETGRFYERTSKPSASVIYYKNTLKQFPNTDVAKSAKDRIQKISPDDDSDL
jgi:outer membrane protein assembly factor BamD (BamD/ComL family)